MKRLLLVAIATAAAAVLAVPTAAWADSSVVGAFGCARQGGQVFEPAGTEIVVRQRFFFGNPGLTVDFLNAQTTTIAVNGGSPVDVSSLWGPPLSAEQFGFAAPASYTQLLYPTGVVLAPGESMTFHFDAATSHLTVDGLTFENGVSGEPLLLAPGPEYGDAGICTVTGV